MQPPTIDDIRAAAQRIEGAVIRTPMLVSRTLSEIIGAEVWLKFENLQFTAAYKERGALNKLLQLTAEERARGVIAASAGNHAQAVAYHAKRLGIPVTIVMPANTPTVKVDPDREPWRDCRAARRHVRRRVRQGARADARERLCLRPPVRRSADHRGRRARSALEMLEDAPRSRHDRRPDRRRRPDVGRCDRRARDEAGHRADRRRGRALSVDEMRDRGLPPAARRRHAGRGHCGQAAGRADLADPEGAGRTTSCWSPSATSSARWRCWSAIEKTVVEGAGAAGLAAMLADPERFAGQEGRRRSCAAAISTRICSPTCWSATSCGSGRIARLRVAAQDQPGALAAITAKFYEAGVNIIEINHSRIFTPAAGQGHGDRGRVRGQGCRRRSTTSWPGSKRPDSRSSARSLD